MPWKGGSISACRLNLVALTCYTKPLKGFIVIPADLPKKGVKRLATSDEKVNHDLWVKMYNLCRVFKTSILAVLTVKSGLGDSYIKGDNSCCVKILSIYFLMLYIIYVTLIMRLWELYNLVAILVEFDMNSLLLFSPNFRKSVRLVINQSVGSCREKLIPEVWSCLSVVCYQRLSLLH